MTEALLVEKKDYICTVSINRPERRNALNPEVLHGLIDIFSSFKAGGDVRVVVLRGAGEKAFCAGFDLGGAVEGNILFDGIESVAACPCPVIAMIYGYAVGAGCDLSSACDFRIAEDSARMGINPVKLGLIYSPKSIQRFISLIGAASTKELFLTGRFLPVQRAKEMGLVNYVVPTDELVATTYALAQEIAENAPLAVAGTKSIINKCLYHKLSAEEEAELQTIAASVRNTEDSREGFRAFAEKRKPQFKGQ